MKFKTRLYLFAMLFALGVLAACSRNSDAPAAMAKSGLVQFFNVVPAIDAIDFYINGTRQNPNKIPYGEFSGYLRTTSGMQSILFKSDSLRDNLFPATPVNIAPDSTTIFVTGKPGAVTTITARDTAQADTGSVKYRPKLRFINASADLASVNVLLNTVSFPNQAYKSISGFSRVDTGRVNLTVTLAGTNTVIKARPMVLQPHGVYTLFIYGAYKNGSTSGLDLGIIVNH